MADDKAMLIPDRTVRGCWRVERLVNGEDIEVALFDGPGAQERAIAFARRYYGDFDQPDDYHPIRETAYFDFVFRDKSRPGPGEDALIEIEDDEGRSLGDLGEWIERKDGSWVLRVDRLRVLRREQPQSGRR